MKNKAELFLNKDKSETDKKKASENESKILSFIGLAKRAGKLSSGEARVLENIKTSKAFLVIISGDSSENTKKRLVDKCKSSKKDFIIFSDRYSLGKFSKKDYAVALSVTEKNIANQIKRLCGLEE